MKTDKEQLGIQSEQKKIDDRFSRSPCCHVLIGVEHFFTPHKFPVRFCIKCFIIYEKNADGILYSVGYKTNEYKDKPDNFYMPIEVYVRSRFPKWTRGEHQPQPQVTVQQKEEKTKELTPAKNIKVEVGKKEVKTDDIEIPF